jgi:hypothetical protein
MGVHEKEKGRKIISLLAHLGNLLGYTVVLEDVMFPGDPASPQLDVTWRRDKHARFPIFIFEVESEPTKSAADNVMKVFSRKTPDFQKPLFFFHVFVEQTIGGQRIDYLRDHYDSLNYDTFLAARDEDRYRLVFDILDQHSRLNSSLNLYELIRLIETQDAIELKSNRVLEKLVEIRYDRLDHASFLLTLERLIVNEDYPAVANFYLPYLTRYLSYKKRPSQGYYYVTATGYSLVTHLAILLLLETQPDYQGVFERLQTIEQEFQPWPLWAPYFGLSQDHDTVLVSEFPILLAVLCAAFAATDYASYFSGKLKDILVKVRPPHNLHGLSWLLIASQIARDEESYAFAQSTMNGQGGIQFHLITTPTPFMDYELDARMLSTDDLVKVPDYPDWKTWLEQAERSEDGNVDILASIIDGLLVMNQPERGRAGIAVFCLRKSLA